jgi:hypothetical protein
MSINNEITYLGVHLTAQSLQTRSGDSTPQICVQVYNFAQLSNVEAGLYLAMWGISGEFRFLC